MRYAGLARAARAGVLPLLAIAAILLSAAANAAESPLRISVTVDLGADQGQNLGTLFEITDADGTVAAGAGFAGSYNTYVRGERSLLQFFVRPKQQPSSWTMERLPTIATKGTGFYPFTVGGELYVYNWPGDDEPGIYRWNSRTHAWEAAEDVDPRTQLVAGKRLRKNATQLLWDGAPLVDTAETREQIGEFYYARGKLFVRQFSGEGDARKNRIAVYPWVAGERPTEPLAENSAWSHPLEIPTEFFYSFGQWQDHVVGATNYGTCVRFAEDRWDVMTKAIPNVSNQIYCGINFYDKLLLGQYPSGCMWEYEGSAPKLRPDWPPVMAGVARTARELQTAAIYGGDLYAGVWPWGEIWRYDRGRSQWDFVQRAFTHPEPQAEFQHPYEAETKQVDKVYNLWGQRITGMAPLGESLFITTSSKSGKAWDPKFDFLTPERVADYGAVYRATLPGNLAASVAWKTGPTVLEFEIGSDRMVVRQDGKVLGEAPLAASLRDEFRPHRIAWGAGAFGPSGAALLRREAPLTLASLPEKMQAAYLHPSVVFADSAAPEACEATVDKLLDQVQSIGLNALFPFFTGSSGEAFYPSELAPRAAFGPHDPLAALVREARDRGLKVYPVVCVAVCGNDQPAGILLQRPEWGLRHPDGSPLGYLSPARPEARQWIIRLIGEILERYEPDGIVLDYIRFHNRPLRLDEEGERSFEQSLPPDCPPAEREQRLQAFKEAAVATWVSEIAQSVRSKRPNAAVGMYCWGPHTLRNHLTAQVWPTWVARGDADFINVSGYYHHDKYGDQFLQRFAEKMQQAVDVNRGLPRSTQLSFSLGVHTSHGSIRSAEEVRQYLDAAKQAGITGVAVFSWHDFLPFLDHFTQSGEQPSPFEF